MKLTKIIILFLLVLFHSCDKETDIEITNEPLQQKQLKTPRTEEISKSGSDCFEDAEHFFELSNYFLDEYPPFSDESFFGTLDEGVECFLDHKNICSGDAVHKEVVSFDTTSGEFDICDIYCQTGSDGPITSDDQDQILENAITFANNNAPVCPDSGEPKIVSNIDFTINFTLGIPGTYFLDMHVEYACCDCSSATISSLFTYEMACEENGTMSVTVTPNDPNPNHWWGLFETDTLGETGDSNTLGQIGSIICCDNGSVTFTGLTRNTFYYIKHGVWNDCFSWRETRIALPNAVYDQNYSTNFSISLSSDFAGNVTVSTLADNNPVSVYHWWDVFYAGPNGETSGNTQVPGNPIQCCSSNTASFSNNLQVNTWYYIKHGIWNGCIPWRETRRAFKLVVKSVKGVETKEVVFKDEQIADLSEEYMRQIEQMLEKQEE